MAEDNDQSSRQLHHLFVEMLFALAIGEVAIDVADLVRMKIYGQICIVQSLAAYSHLLLATGVIATSWVGWRKSAFSGSEMKSVFSCDFLELLLDVFLVVLYFLLVRLAEIPGDPSRSLIPEAASEIWVIAAIMVAYLVWDVLSCRTDGHKLRSRVWASVVSVALAVLAVFTLPSRSDVPGAVILSDLALLILVFSFRAMKLHDWREHTRRSWSLVGALVAAFVAMSIAARITA
jgi:hypothetical protein